MDFFDEHNGGALLADSDFAVGGAHVVEEVADPHG